VWEDDVHLTPTPRQRQVDAALEFMTWAKRQTLKQIRVAGLLTTQLEFGTDQHATLEKASLGYPREIGPNQFVHNI